MDVLVLEPNRSRSMPGSPGEPPLELTRRRRLWPFGRQTGTAPSGSAGGATTLRRNGLYTWTATSIVLGLGLLAWTSIVNPPLQAIDAQFPAGTVLSGPTGGLLLWLVYGLLGSLRVLRAPGGASMTFHLPFIGAAMILGGPTAGAWVAFLSSIERRELESQPWYGILANHATLVIAAVVGGLAAQLTGALLGSDGHGASALATAAVGSLVLAGVATSMAVATILLREDMSLEGFLEMLLGQVGRITAVECALVVVLALAFTEIGWWAPLLVGGFVIMVWDNHPMPAPDGLTGILNAEGFGRRLDGGLGRMRRGSTPGATLLSIDLDLFHAVNNQYGHAVGDEVLAEIGTRLAAQARRPHDLAGRLGGDEFALFLPGLVETDVAMRRADDVAASIASPIATSVGPVTIGASVGVLVLASWGGVPSAGTVLRHADQAMYHAKRDGSRIHLYDGREAAPFEDTWLESRR
jgi:diguanylate cyclase (GGDEF)-like protein